MKKKILLVLMFALVLAVAGCSSNRGNQQPEPEYDLVTVGNVGVPIENEETEYEAMPIYETNAEDENEEEHTPSPPTPIILTDPRVRWVVEPQWEFFLVGSFIEGASWAVAFDYVNGIRTTVYGYINSRGEIIIPFENNPIGEMGTSAALPPQNFSEGLVVLQPINDMHMELQGVGLNGVFNIDGELVFSLSGHSWATPFSEGLAAVMGYGYVDTAGNLVIPRLSSRLGSFRDGMALVAEEFWEEDGNRNFTQRLEWELIDANGNTIMPLDYDIVAPFSEGLAAVMLDNKVGYINKSGELVIPFDFDVGINSYCGSPELRSFNEGLAAVVSREQGRSDRWGFINTQGEVIVPFIYDWVLDFWEGHAMVLHYDARYIMFIDRYGNEAIGYTYAQSFTSGLAPAQLGRWPDDKWGFTDREGNIVVPIEFDDVRSFSEGLAWVRQGNLWGIIEIVEETVAVFDSNINFTTYWAKTDEYFFLSVEAGIGRLPFSDITQVYIIPVPDNGEVGFAGINEDYIFVYRRDIIDWQYYRINTYRVLLQTLEATLIDSGSYNGVPFYHAASNSILFARQKRHRDSNTFLFWLEALLLDTGERRTIYESNYRIAMEGLHWWEMKDGIVLVDYGYYIFITSI